MNKNFIRPFLYGVVLTGCAVFLYEDRTFLLTALLLVLPLLDRNWQFSKCKPYPFRLPLLFTLAGFAISFIFINPDYLYYSFFSLLLIAFPEEWFFRAYFMVRITNNGLRAYQSNILTSLLFTSLHIPTQGWWGISVFFPSLVYGYTYQKTHDLILLILLHALSNILFAIYLKDILTGY